MNFRPSNDTQLKFLAFLGAAALAVSQSDRAIADPKLWALALAAGAAAVVALLRPPAAPQQQERQPPAQIGKG